MIVNIGENIFGICLNDFKSLIPFGIYAESRSVLILRTQKQKRLSVSGQPFTSKLN